ncbi:MAG TPA: RDD family protein, partial [Vicinamibacteria bacterium]|nr:RDD family protein [Vicinamibacteria bacterium]
FEPPAPAVRPMAARTGRGVPREAGGIELGSDEADLPLSPLAPPITNAVPDLGLSEAADPGSSSGDRQAAHAAEARPRAATAGGPEWTLGAEAAPEVRPVERPAYSGERIQAASLDLVLLAALWTVVVYFASRAARVDLVGLAPAWPYLLAYLAFLGLTYAGYFTGTTGQTLGKIATGLRVVDAGGRPPGYLRAFLRAVLGSAGVLLAGAGLVPILLDPARRALHDRLLKTRVVKG